MNGQGWPFKGRTGHDDPSNWYHQATRDEGSREAAIRPGCTFFWLLFFVQAKKSNSPLVVKPKLKPRPLGAKPRETPKLHFKMFAF